MSIWAIVSFVSLTTYYRLGILLEEITDLLMESPRWLVLTGAGISSDSGIPTYRNKFGRWKRKQPVTHQEFVKNLSSRQRFWARNVVGWRFISQAKPNRAHYAIRDLQNKGAMIGLVTQNVDGLHQLAGSKNVVDLHGRIDRVKCLSCGDSLSRSSLQSWFESRNPEFAHQAGQVAPDGDADADNLEFTRLSVPCCLKCEGILKPDVVFFGDSVPLKRLKTAKEMMDSASGLLVIGSSLMTYSGYRFCLWADDQNKPIALINEGETRADHLATTKAWAPCAPVLQNWLERLSV